MTPQEERQSETQGESGLFILFKVALLVAIPAAIFAVIRVLLGS